MISSSPIGKIPWIALLVLLFVNCAHSEELCMLCKEGLDQMAWPITVIENDGTTCSSKALKMAKSMQPESSQCTAQQAQWRGECCGRTPPTSVEMEPAAPLPEIRKIGNNNRCGVCWNGDAPTKNNVMTVLYLGSASCDQYEMMGQQGLIPDYLCDPIQFFAYEVCGCGEFARPEKVWAPTVTPYFGDETETPTLAPISVGTPGPTPNPTLRPTPELDLNLRTRPPANVESTPQLTTSPTLSTTSPTLTPTILPTLSPTHGPTKKPFSSVTTSATTTTTENEYKGCWKDLPAKRAMEQLAGYYYDIDSCIEKCKTLDWDFAGLQYHHQCFCGSDYSVNGMADETECSHGCITGKGICGGEWRLSVYQTGFNMQPALPTSMPANKPTPLPSKRPTETPNEAFTANPTEIPIFATLEPTNPGSTTATSPMSTENPTLTPTTKSTSHPTTLSTEKSASRPTNKPTSGPTMLPNFATLEPTQQSLLNPTPGLIPNPTTATTTSLPFFNSGSDSEPTDSGGGEEEDLPVFNSVEGMLLLDPVKIINTVNLDEQDAIPAFSQSSAWNGRGGGSGGLRVRRR